MIPYKYENKFMKQVSVSNLIFFAHPAVSSQNVDKLENNNPNPINLLNKLTMWALKSHAYCSFPPPIYERI